MLVPDKTNLPNAGNVYCGTTITTEFGFTTGDWMNALREQADSWSNQNKQG